MYSSFSLELIKDTVRTIDTCSVLLEAFTYLQKKNRENNIYRWIFALSLANRFKLTLTSPDDVIEIITYFIDHLIIYYSICSDWNNIYRREYEVENLIEKVGG